MDWVFDNKLWILVLLAIGAFAFMVPLLFRERVARRIGAAEVPKPSQPSNVYPFPSRNHQAATSTGAAQSLAVNEIPCSSAAAAALQSGTLPAECGSWVTPEYHEVPTPFTIVAEVCASQPPVREQIEQSFRGVDVRWKLRLGTVSDGVQHGPIRSIRMYPDAKSAESCGIYFVANLEEHPDLQAAQKGEVFVVEGTIESVSGMDIDLKNVHKVRRGA